jgi:hypothetical protein
MTHDGTTTRYSCSLTACYADDEVLSVRMMIALWVAGRDGDPLEPGA